MFLLNTSDAFAELGASLHQLLTGLEDLGVDSLPADVESEMRRAMSMSPGPGQSESLASSVFASQFGTPYGLSPAEEVAFSSMIQQMIVGGGVGPMAMGDTDAVMEHIIWDSEEPWETELLPSATM